MGDFQLKQEVIDELDWEPSVDAAHIGVAVDGGVVTLTGHVGSYLEKMAAERAVRRVEGVKAIAQEIEVRVSAVRVIDDEEIAKQALQSLQSHASEPEQEIQVMVRDGRVTLTGEVDWQYQREGADAAVRTLTGVSSVNNHVKIRKRAEPLDIRTRIQAALQRNASANAARIDFVVEDGKVVLTGKAHSLHDRQVIEDAVWAAPGVRVVEDRIKIG